MVMDGFICRIWRNKKVDKMIMLKRGVFFVRLMTMDSRDQALGGNVNFFDKTTFCQSMGS